VQVLIVFEKKGLKIFQKKVWEPLNFMEKMSKKKSYRQYHQSRQLRYHLVNSNFTFTKLKKLIFANKVNYKSFNYVGTIKRVAVYIFHFQFCNNRLFQGDDVTALTDDITYSRLFCH
jgi:hypothetical protein